MIHATKSASKRWLAATKDTISHQEPPTLAMVNVAPTASIIQATGGGAAGSAASTHDVLEQQQPPEPRGGTRSGHPYPERRTVKAKRPRMSKTKPIALPAPPTFFLNNPWVPSTRPFAHKSNNLPKKDVMDIEPIANAAAPVDTSAWDDATSKRIADTMLEPPTKLLRLDDHGRMVLASTRAGAGGLDGAVLDSVIESMEPNDDDETPCMMGFLTINTMMDIQGGGAPDAAVDSNGDAENVEQANDDEEERSNNKRSWDDMMGIRAQTDEEESDSWLNTLFSVLDAADSNCGGQDEYEPAPSSWEDMMQAQDQAKLNTWKCHCCTTRNGIELFICTLCDAKRPTTSE